MDVVARRDLTLIPLTLLLALIVDQIALPAGFGGMRPPLMLLVVLFWCLITPHWVGVSVAWLVGLVSDVLSGGLLGANAMAFSMAGYLMLMLHQQVRVLPLMQQSLFVLMILVCARLLLLLTLLATGKSVAPEVLYPALIGALVWAPVVLMVQRWRINSELSR